jgi:stalled ribosome rescue protein Dom34
MENFHAVVWVDHDEAYVIQFNPGETEERVVRSKHRNGHLRRKSGQAGAGRTPEDRRFYGLVATALAGAREILVVGPANAKHELGKHMKQHAKALAACIVGVARRPPIRWPAFAACANVI